MNREGSIKLLNLILADLPRLDRAACIGHHRTFDPVCRNTRQHQHQEQIRLAKAARICAGCPASHRCPIKKAIMRVGRY